MLPETRDIFPGLTVRQNLLLGEKPGNAGVSLDDERHVPHLPVA